jgi:ABC-2 type transport system ATP-binding protein
MSIIVSHLTKSYKGQKAVDDISFELQPGEITGFIGPNGSGKSTTMKSICGIITPDSGQIFIKGKDIALQALDIKRQIGYLPENNPLYGEQYVEEYLRYVGSIYKIERLGERVNEIIQQTGLTPERKKKIAQLSKGYKQRVGLAQALIHNPEILILDEPTTGLDPNQLTEIRELICEVAKQKTVMLSTHILTEVEAICHKVLMIDHGRIVADAATGNIQQGTNTKQIIMVEFKQEITEELIKKIPGVSGFSKHSSAVWILESTDKNDLRESIFAFATSHQLGILELQSRKRSLEDSFRELSAGNHQ